jgi:lipopolysaccharide transport system ATP-binding protein
MIDLPAMPLQCTGVEVDFPLPAVTLWDRLRGLPPGTPSVRALSGVSLDVPRGDIVGVIGKNGAGKSTLLRVLGEVLPPTRGSVARVGTVAGVFELGGFGHPHLSGRAYASRYLRLTDVPGDRVPQVLDDIHRFSELGEAFDRPIRTYSSGMSARLYFATATAPHRDIYLVDELLAVGDEHFQTKCHARFRELLSGGASGVLVTHDWSSVIRLCRQAHVMDRGRVAFAGPADQAVVHYLDIASPAADRARFTGADRAYAAESGRDAVLPFAIELCDDVATEMSISIELLRMGVGWEIVLLSGWTAIGERQGHYDAAVRIPAMPLPAGSYSLNAFLRQRPEPGAAAQLFDLRSWTAGSGLTLTVTGPERDQFRLPFRAGRTVSS